MFYIDMVYIREKKTETKSDSDGWTFSVYDYDIYVYKKNADWFLCLCKIDKLKYLWTFGQQKKIFNLYQTMIVIDR